MICCSFCLYTLECWVFKTAHWLFKTGFYPCNGDEKLKKGENGGNLTLCWSANLELVANLLGSQSIWGNQMGGPEIRILERDRPKLDQISWNRNLNWRNSSSEAVLRKKVLQTKNQCVPWFDQWVSSSTEGLFLIQNLDEVTIEKSRKRSGLFNYENESWHQGVWGWSGQPDQLLSGFRSILPINQCTPSASVHIDHLAEINQFSSSMFYVNQSLRKSCPLEHTSEVWRRFRMHFVQIYQERERENLFPSFLHSLCMS